MGENFSFKYIMRGIYCESETHHILSTSFSELIGDTTTKKGQLTHAFILQPNIPYLIVNDPQCTKANTLSLHVSV